MAPKLRLHGLLLIARLTKAFVSPVSTKPKSFAFILIIGGRRLGRVFLGHMRRIGSPRSDRPSLALRLFDSRPGPHSRCAFALGDTGGPIRGQSRRRGLPSNALWAGEWRPSNGYKFGQVIDRISRRRFQPAALKPRSGTVQHQWQHIPRARRHIWARPDAVSATNTICWQTGKCRMSFFD